MACSSGRLGIFFFAYSAHTDLMGKSSSCPVQNRFKDFALNYLSETFQTASQTLVEIGDELVLLPRADVKKIVVGFGSFQEWKVFSLVGRAGIVEYDHPYG